MSIQECIDAAIAFDVAARCKRAHDDAVAVMFLAMEQMDARLVMAQMDPGKRPHLNAAILRVQRAVDAERRAGAMEGIYHDDPNPVVARMAAEATDGTAFADAWIEHCGAPLKTAIRVMNDAAERMPLAGAVDPSVLRSMRRTHAAVEAERKRTLATHGGKRFKGTLAVRLRAIQAEREEVEKLHAFDRDRFNRLRESHYRDCIYGEFPGGPGPTFGELERERLSERQTAIEGQRHRVLEEAKNDPAELESASADLAAQLRGYKAFLDDAIEYLSGDTDKRPQMSVSL